MRYGSEITLNWLKGAKKMSHFARINFVLLCFALIAPAFAVNPQLTINPLNPGIQISPHLWGVFFEEINHAGDGGLYAELIRNRSFEDSATEAANWSVFTTGSGAATLALETANQLNSAQTQSLKITVTSAASGSLAGASNSGYWGISLTAGAIYDLSFYARASSSFAGSLQISLRNGSQIAAATSLTGLDTQWKRFSCRLTSSLTAPAASLAIAADSPGTVWLDAVSLFPEATWRGMPNGFRPDLAQLVDDIHPAFMRFPGGWFVEGNTMSNAYRWKQTIGPIQTRPGHAGTWGYRSTDGLGFHEYLLWCEQMKAEPLYVINCGMSVNDVVSTDSLFPWIQDALDAIEYANGETSTTWGAERARNGHPAPFNMKYVEIGNENGGTDYDTRYALFHDAIKARYPDMNLIAMEWGSLPSSRAVAIYDEHNYNSPDWFRSNAGRWDSYSRSGPKVYYGEYASTSPDAGQGNLKAALGEAAFMLGIERNSDLVTMATYAPLFVNVNDRVWNPDAIVFDSSRACATPSYYVQKLFSNNRGDRVLPMTLTGVGLDTPPLARGKIGLGTWSTVAEYDDVQVTINGQTVFSDDFSNGSSKWTPLSGTWAVTSGAYRQTQTITDCRAVAGDETWGDYVLTLRARKISGSEGFLIMARYSNSSNYVWLNLGGWNNTLHALEGRDRGNVIGPYQLKSGTINTNQWYSIRIEAQGHEIKCYLDGTLLYDASDLWNTTGLPQLTAGAALDESTGEVIIKAVNFDSQPQTATIALSGVNHPAWQGTAETLSAPSVMTENSLDNPEFVVPVASTFSFAGNSFQQTFSPNSFTVLRLTPPKNGSSGWSEYE